MFQVCRQPDHVWCWFLSRSKVELQKWRDEGRQEGSEKVSFLREIYKQYVFTILNRHWVCFKSNWQDILYSPLGTKFLRFQCAIKMRKSHSYQLPCLHIQGPKIKWTFLKGWGQSPNLRHNKILSKASRCFEHDASISKNNYIGRLLTEKSHQRAAPADSSIPQKTPAPSAPRESLLASFLRSCLWMRSHG